jgi:hypothetical protein
MREGRNCLLKIAFLLQWITIRKSENMMKEIPDSILERACRMSDHLQHLRQAMNQGVESSVQLI